MAAALLGCGGSGLGAGDGDGGGGRDGGAGRDAAVAPDASGDAGPEVDAATPDAGGDPRFVDGLMRGPGWWLRTLAITGGNLGWSGLAVDTQNRIHVAGGGALDATIRDQTEIYDPIVQTYDVAGTPLRRLGSIDVPGNTWVSGLATGPGDLLCLSGGHIAAGLPVIDDADPWVRCHDAGGAVLGEWLRTSQHGDSASGVAIDGSGAIVAAGHARTPDPYLHGFVARLQPSGSLTWVDDFDDGVRGDDLAGSVVAAAQGGFLVAGSSDTSQNPGKIWLRGYSATGTLRFSREIGRLEGEWLTATPDGGAITHEFHSALVKHDEGGVARWTLPLPAPPGRDLIAGGVAAAPDGTVYVVLRDSGGSTAPGPELLLTLDAGGHELARRSLDMLPSSCLLDLLAVDHSGGVLVGGECVWTGTGSGYAALLRLAPAGHVEP